MCIEKVLNLVHLSRRSVAAVCSVTPDILRRSWTDAGWSWLSPWCVQCAVNLSAHIGTKVLRKLYWAVSKTTSKVFSASNSYLNKLFNVSTLSRWPCINMNFITIKLYYKQWVITFFVLHETEELNEIMHVFFSPTYKYKSRTETAKFTPILNPRFSRVLNLNSIFPFWLGFAFPRGLT